MSHRSRDMRVGAGGAEGPNLATSTTERRHRVEFVMLSTDLRESEDESEEA